MSSTFVIHWSNPKRRIDGQQLLVGDTAACARAIMAGDGFDADEVTKVERYDTDEHTADVIPLDEIARTVAREAEREQVEGSGGVPVKLWDFIHDHGGSQMVRGLKILDRTFAAA